MCCLNLALDGDDNIGTIDASSDPSRDGTFFRLQLLPHDYLAFTWSEHGHQRQLTLCGPDVPQPGRCGA